MTRSSLWPWKFCFTCLQAIRAISRSFPATRVVVKGVFRLPRGKREKFSKAMTDLSESIARTHLCSNFPICCWRVFLIVFLLTLYAWLKSDFNFLLRKSGNDNDVNRYSTKRYSFLFYKRKKNWPRNWIVSLLLFVIF